MGRRRMEAKKIDNLQARLVAFSKRRHGLFNKANEISILCGAEVAILVFSETGKIYSFGHPCLNTILDKFIIKSLLPDEENQLQIDSSEGATIQELNKEIIELLKQLEEEKKRGKALKQLREEEIKSGQWWQELIEDLDLPKLKHLMLSMGDLREYAIKHADLIRDHAYFPLRFLAANSTKAAIPRELSN